ncbi:MAG: hypothetical protein O7C75_02190, partial [Verrucomicrobia bacterium]|nr:hypothetical protein [Verrucomicrobiota bacterium]
GGALEITIICRYSDGEYPLGKFRVFATDSADPLNLGLPASVAGILSKAPSARSEEESSMISEWYKFQDPDYLTKRFAWIKAQRPLPLDEKMEQLKMALTWAERAVPDDPPIVQLRSDVYYSVEQVANRRLTGAQDLTWALINNSAFIFNH